MDGLRLRIARGLGADAGCALLGRAQDLDTSEFLPRKLVDGQTVQTGGGHKHQQSFRHLPPCIFLVKAGSAQNLAENIIGCVPAVGDRVSLLSSKSCVSSNLLVGPRCFRSLVCYVGVL